MRSTRRPRSRAPRTFFFVIGLEVRGELSVGELAHRRRVRLPLLAGLAGMAVPAAIYLLLKPVVAGGSPTRARTRDAATPGGTSSVDYQP